MTLVVYSAGSLYADTLMMPVNQAQVPFFNATKIFVDDRQEAAIASVGVTPNRQFVNKLADLFKSRVKDCALPGKAFVRTTFNQALAELRIAHQCRSDMLILTRTQIALIAEDIWFLEFSDEMAFGTGAMAFQVARVCGFDIPKAFKFAHEQALWVGEEMMEFSQETLTPYLFEPANAQKVSYGHS